MLSVEVIYPSQSDRASFIAIAPKKDGSPRFCVDYQNLNEATKPESYPIPRMND